MNILENSFEYRLHNYPQIDLLELCQALPVPFFREVYSCGQRGKHLPYRKGEDTCRSKRTQLLFSQARVSKKHPASCLQSATNDHFVPAIVEKKAQKKCM